MNSQVKNADKGDGKIYDCNICLDIAKDSASTYCRNLFCRACFYQVLCVDSTSKECPICNGEVSDSTIIPVNGDGGNYPVDDENLMNLADIHLNEGPMAAPLFYSIARVGSLLHELEMPHGSVQERVPQLQVDSRETSQFSSEVAVDVDAERDILDGITNMGILDMTGEKNRGYIRDCSHLVAMALEMDSQLKKADEGVANYKSTSKECPVCRGEVSEYHNKDYLKT